jgi:limonene-1,2-epoxide hydrolase
VQGTTFTLEAVSVADVGGDGKITRWREYFDWKSLADQFEAAGIATPT